jgi:DNA helicase II / ATP-dependent DNA helicase PcrA
MSNIKKIKKSKKTETIFTKSQLEAMSHRKGHLQIIACPGSGKTEAVSQRIAGMVQEGIKPKGIAAFTFTEKAAEELKNRVRGILEKDCPDRSDIGDMFIGTIHEFCFQMIREIDPVYRTYDVLDDARRIAFLAKPQNFFTKVGLVKLKNHHELRHFDTINRFVYSVDVMLMDNINPKDLDDERFADCFEKYLDVLDEERYFDFSTIIHKFVTEIMNDPKKQKIISEKIKHVILDEYQDVNGQQELLLSLLSRDADSVCVVGDDDQCIYHWRGSNPNLIASFKKRYENDYDVTQVHLDTNFRSTDAIVHTATSLIRNNTDRLVKSMKHNKKLKRKYEKGDIVHKHFDSEPEEESFVVQKIQDLVGTDFIDKKNNPYALSLGDMAILVRTNEDGEKMIRALERNGIDCVAYNSNSVFDRAEVRFAMDCISYVFSSRGFTTDDTPNIDGLVEKYSMIFSKSKFKNADSKKFRKRMEKIRMEGDAILAKSPKDYLGGLGLQEFYFRILNAMGAGEFDFGDVYHYNLAALSRAISDYETVWKRLRAKEITGFIYFVFAYARSHYADTQHSNGTIIDAVKVLTIHKAKGLEFPVVFIPKFVQKRKPRSQKSFVDSSLYDSERYDGDDEDRRRLFYTAITRSEKYLFITGSKRLEGRKQDYVPNKFLEEIDMKYISNVTHVDKINSGLTPRLDGSSKFNASFTEMSCYGRCPHDYKLRHVMGYNAGVPVTFGYGTNIHNILNYIHTEYLKDGKVPNTKEINAIFKKMFSMRYATEKITKNMIKAGKKIVKNYVKIHSKDFASILDTEKRFEFVVDGTMITGVIDLLKKVDDSGNVTHVNILDFKTEKEDGIYSVDYEKQVRYYAIGCLESLGLKPSKAFVHSLDGDKIREIDISDDKLVDTKKEIGNQVDSILAKKFNAKPKKSHCDGCDYRNVCSFKPETGKN